MPTFSTGAAGVPSSRKFPRVYTQVVLGASPNSAGGATRTLLIFANKTSAGTATVDTEIVGPITPDLAETKFGIGSEGHLAAKALAAKAPGATAYMIAVTESAGVKASVTLTVTGTAGGNGELVVKIHRVKVRVSVLSGQAQNTIAANISAAINGAGKDLCVTAGVATNVVTITFRHNGTRGNLVKVYAEAESTITVTTFVLSATALSGGTLADTLTAALATVAAAKYNFYVPANVDTTALQACQTQIGTLAGPLVGKRTQLVYASVDTQGTATTQAEALNESRAQCIWLKAGEDLPVVMAAAWAGMRAVAEQIDPNENLSSFNPDLVDLWPIVGPPNSSANWCTETEAEAALDTGITPVMIREGDSHPYIPLSITTHSNDSGGAPDTRTLTTNMVTVPDRWADEVEAHMSTAYPGMYLKADPEEGDDPLPPKTLTPGTIKTALKDLARRKMADRGFIKDLDTDYLSWAFNVDASNENRCDATMGIHPTPWFTQFSSAIRQLSGT